MLARTISDLKDILTDKRIHCPACQSTELSLHDLYGREKLRKLRWEMEYQTWIACALVSCLNCGFLMKFNLDINLKKP